jgi:hypothetical protein
MSRVNRLWDGRTAVCIATGPSLTREQIERVRASGAATIAVNDAYLLADFADVCYFADEKWYRWQMEGKDKPVLGLSASDVQDRWRGFRGQKVSIRIDGKARLVGPEVHLLWKSKAMGPLSLSPTELYTGAHSGYQAVNLAVLSGANRIILLGYDFREDGGRHHFFGGHPDRSKVDYGNRRQYVFLAGALRPLGIEVLNATPESAIGCFRRVTLDESLLPDPPAAVVPA